MQFALNLEPGIDEMCDRTLERYRAIFLEDDLAAQVMNDVTSSFVHELDLHIDQQRLDSTHIFSDMAKIVVKAKTGGRCVQNPSDRDATYDGHKGQGHKVQLVETCSDENDVQLILLAIPQTAADHDAAALEPVLADLKAKELLPEQMLADTAYGSDENVQAAANLGVELVTPTPGNEPISTDAPPTSMEKLTIDDFSVDERTGKVSACPSGRIPLNVLYEQGKSKDKIVIEMRSEDCASCPYREACPVQKTKKDKYKLEYTPKQRRLEERRREEDTPAFRERYAKRSGLESTNGGMKRKHDLGQLRVRGSPAVHHAIYLKVAGWNLNRATASGKLTSMVAEILRKLGFGVGWSACFSFVCALIRVYRPWRPLLRANAA